MNVQDKIAELMEQKKELQKNFTDASGMFDTLTEIQLGKISLEEAIVHHDSLMRGYEKHCADIQTQLNLLESLDPTPVGKRPPEKKVAQGPDKSPLSKDLNVYEQGLLEDGQDGVKMTTGTMTDWPKEQVIFL